MTDFGMRLYKNTKLFLRRLLPVSLFGRSLLILIVPVLLTQTLATFIFFDRHWDNMTRRLAEAVAGEVAIISDHLEKDLNANETISFLTHATRKLSLQIEVDLSNNTIPAVPKDKQWDSSVVEKLEEAMEKIVDRPYAIRSYEEGETIEIVVALSDNGLLSVIVPEKRLFSSTAYIFLAWMIGASLLLMGIAIVFMRNQIKPIKRLAWAADRFGRGLDVPNLKAHGAREVRKAMHAFKEMQERLRRQIEQRTIMLAGVSHDLRTPVTRMKIQLAMMPEGEDRDALTSDLQEMERMIEGYLSFVSGAEGEAPTTVDVKTMIEALALKKERAGNVLEQAVQNDLSIMVRQHSFERALDNILSNAFKYGDRVWVRAYKIANMVEIVVEDNGPGIPEDKMQDVFKPFVRLDGSRNFSTGGVGLGLSIAQDIIHHHGGEIFLEKSNRGGLRVVIRMP